MELLLSKLSKEQRDSVLEKSLRTCILAGAGSGKTGTLVSSVVLDLVNGVPPSAIIAFTFTEKAAKELLARIYTLANEFLPDLDISDIFIGTIHSWCHHFLSNIKKFRNFDSLDELQLDALVSRLYDELGIGSAYGQIYPRGIDTFLYDLEIFYNESILISEAPQAIQSLLARFLKVLDENKLLTFGGMINYTTKTLETQGAIESLEVLYVDEYQDVNPAQVALIKAMIREDTKLVVVGDDLQCIYNWRGSDVSRILNFSKEFDDAEIKRLSANYRSRPDIAEFGNKIAQNIILRDPLKKMVSQRSPDGTANVTWLSCGSDNEEIETIVAIVQKFYSTGVPYSKIVILLRSVLSSGQEIRQGLIDHGIPVECPILSRALGFINQFIIPLLKWLRLDTDEPKNQEQEDYLNNEANNLWAACQNWSTNSNEETELNFWACIEKWNTSIQAKSNDAYNVRGILYDILDSANVRLQEGNDELTMGLSIASQIIRGVEEIHRRRLKNFDRRTPSGLLSEVINSLIRNSASFGESQPLEYRDDGVLITTVHQSKGLEWPIVIIPKLKIRKFPLQIPQKPTSFPTDVSIKYATRTEDEYRLFYVACTRAMERLFLLDAYKQDPQDRSIFLKNILAQGQLVPQSLEEINGDIFTIVNETKKEDAPLEIGLSDLLTYLACPYNFALNKKASIQPAVGDELGFGKSLHEVIQRRIDENVAWDMAKTTAEAEESVHLPLMSLEGENSSKKAIISRLLSLQEFGAFTTESLSEVEIEISLGDAVITGKVDGITQLGDGTFIIKDWKSTLHLEFLPRYEKQLQFYYYALNKKGHNITSAELIDVAQTVKQKKIVRHIVDVSSKSINNVVTLLENAIRGIRSNVYEPTPSLESCGGCDMKKLCQKRYEI